MKIFKSLVVATIIIGTMYSGACLAADSNDLIKKDLDFKTESVKKEIVKNSVNDLVVMKLKGFMDEKNNIIVGNEELGDTYKNILVGVQKIGHTANNIIVGNLKEEVSTGEENQEIFEQIMSKLKKSKIFSLGGYKVYTK